MPHSFVRYARITLNGSPTFIALDSRGFAHVLDGAPWAAASATGQELSPSALESVTWLCPVSPSKIIGIGRNYRKHAEELGNAVPEEPLMFFKPPSSLLDPGGAVRLPPESTRVDHEAELAVVIGRRVRRIGVEEAGRAVFGYSIACDVTARDLQQKDKQWTRGKGFDTFCPLGPAVVPLPGAGSLGLELRVGAELRQAGSTKDMIHDVPTLVAYASQTMTLEPGDVILTGTPEGVGPLAPGDAVTIAIEGLGSLAFHVAAEQR